MIIKDEQKATTRGRTFNYIKERDNTLRHISKYAASETKARDRRAYEVPVERIQGKEVYEFGFTNSGGFITVKKKTGTDYESVSFDELQNLKFEIESNEVEALVKEIEGLYNFMITEINDFKAKMDMDHISTSERVSDYLKDVRYGLVSSLCNWPEKARVKSLEQTSKLIHQLWTLKEVHKALGVKEIVNGWHTEQGKESPASIFLDDQGNNWSCWFEPQRIKGTSLTSFFEEARAARKKYVTIPTGKSWKRPDIIISRGSYNSLFDVSRFDFLIECKNLPPERWYPGASWNQLLPYTNHFNPKVLIVAALEPVPDRIKSRLEGEGFRVVDNFRPGQKGVSKFREFVKDK